MLRFAHALWNDEAGQDLVEYGLIFAFISLAAAAAVAMLGNGVVSSLQSSAEEIENLTSSSGEG